MANPVFSSNAVFSGRAQQPSMAPPGAYGGYGQAGPVPGTTMTPQQLTQMYYGPDATVRDTGRMTYDDVVIKTGFLFVLLLITAVISWVAVTTTPELALPLLAGSFVVSLVLGLVNAFKKNPSPILISIYALAEGLLIGTVSRLYEYMSEGAVTIAVIATLATVAATLAVYKSGRIRVTNKMVRWGSILVIGYVLFSLVNVLLVSTGVLSGYGLRSGSLGMIIGLFAVGLAAFMLLLDFDSIKRGVDSGVPRKFAWQAGFGLMVTIIWLYLEILRLVAILRR